MAKVGLQLYTVRDHLERDFEGTLRKVAELGYKGVEFAGFTGELWNKYSKSCRKPGWLRWVPIRLTTV
ncbi:hypothetical protein HMSSN036_09930 [Paenibacillus macerans]|nr:hypothetical protein HMSSN036_09930 [Paenibacillus macerans]